MGHCCFHTQTEAAGLSEMLLCFEKSTQNHTPKDSNLSSLLKIYGVIQEERAIFLGGDSIGHCENKMFI